MYMSQILKSLVIQELMQTDLHRVIRTQHLTDDHCQVRPATPISTDVYYSSVSPVLCIPDSQSTQIYP